MGAVWSALLVGGGLAGALLVWLLRGGPEDRGKDGGAGRLQDAPPGEAAQAGGGGGRDQGPSQREPLAKAGMLPPGGRAERRGGRPPRVSPPSRPSLVPPPGQVSCPGESRGPGEHLQESNGRLISETKGLGSMQEAAQRPQNPGTGWSKAGGSVAAATLDAQSRASSEGVGSRCSSAVSGNETLECHIGEWRFQKGHKIPEEAAACFAEMLPPHSLCTGRANAASQSQVDTNAPAGHEDCEVLPRYSSSGDVGLGGSHGASRASPSQGKDCGRNTLVEAKGWGVDGETKGVAATSSESQQVSIRFQVHYITSTTVQFIAVTGDHESLGRWDTYIPLHYHKDGLWSHSVLLPADTVVEWKFVLVEDGGVTRWEECSNRLLETGREDKVVHRWWGIH
ncbi:starch-binding domain-containing protein 1 [Ctenodactylus gundi]